MNMFRPSIPVFFLVAGFAVYGYAQRTARPGVELPSSSVQVSDAGPTVHRWQRSAPRPGLAAELRGRVVDQRGRGVVGVEVSDPAAAVRTRTDAEGGFSLRVMAGKRLLLQASHDDGRRAQLWTAADERPTLLLQAPLFSARQGGAAASTAPQRAGALHLGEGRVHGHQGKVLVMVVETGAQAAADEHGRYEIPVPQQEFHLVAWDSSGQVARSAVIPAPSTSQTRMPIQRLQMEPGLALVGTLRRPDGAPVADAAVAVSGSGAARQLRTSEHGLFRAEGLLPGSYTVTALPHDGLVGSGKELDLDAGPMPNLELSLRPERPLELQLVDGSGQVQPGLLVEAREAGYLCASAETDTEGRATLAGLGKGELSFRVFRRQTEDQAEELEVQQFDAASGRLLLR